MKPFLINSEIEVTKRGKKCSDIYPDIINKSLLMNKEVCFNTTTKKTAVDAETTDDD